MQGLALNVGFVQVGQLDARVSVERGVCPGGSSCCKS